MSNLFKEIKGNFNEFLREFSSLKTYKDIFIDIWIDFEVNLYKKILYLAFFYIIFALSFYLMSGNFFASLLIGLVGLVMPIAFWVSAIIFIGIPYLFWYIVFEPIVSYFKELKDAKNVGNKTTYNAKSKRVISKKATPLKQAKDFFPKTESILMKNNKNKVGNDMTVRNETSLTRKSEQILMDEWNPEQIIKGFIQTRSDQNIFVSYYESIKERFITGQDTKTSRKRYEFLRTQFEQLKLTKDFAELYGEIKLHALKQESNVLQATIENKKLWNQLQSEDHQHSISELRQKKEVLKEEVEIAELEKKIQTIKNPLQQPKPLSREEIKAKKRSDIENQIETLENEIKRIRDNPNLSEDDKQMRINPIINRLAQFHQERIDLL